MSSPSIFTISSITRLTIPLSGRRLGVYGGLIFTPIVLPWYKLIDRVKLPSRAGSIAAKVALDQLVFAPFAIGLFFTGTSLLEGKSLHSVGEKLDKSWLATLKANWVVFVPFQTINMVSPKEDMEGRLMGCV